MMKKEKKEIKISKFSKFMSELLVLPIWIKQLMYIYLRYKLEEELTPQYLNSYELDDIFQVHKAILTYKGKKEHETKALQLSENHYVFLQDSIDGMTIAEIAIKNNWNLYEISNIFIDCLDKEFISMPVSLKMVELVRYMSGKTRLCEYFFRTGQITLEVLETVLEQQERIKRATNEQIGSATVLVNMGFVQESEIKAVLRYKEESRKRFSMEELVSNEEFYGEDDAQSLASMNERLMKENRILKMQLRKLLNLSE